MWWRFPFIYINFNFDFLDLHNVFFKNYFANELTRSIMGGFTGGGGLGGVKLP